MQEKVHHEKEVKRKQEEKRRQEEDQDRRRKERQRKEDEEIRRKEEMQRQQEEAQCSRHDAAYSLLEFSLQELTKDRGTQTEVAMTSASQQTEDDPAHRVETLQAENKELKQRSFGVSAIQGNDKATKFYTGLTKYSIFLHLFLFLSPFVKRSRSLALDEELFLTLARLRLNLLLEDLARRYSISVGITSKIIQKWLEVMFVRLQFLITWPKREINSANMPPLFKLFYPSCRVIIDCSEVFIETPSCFDARSKTYSNYKKHNTVKFLIGITPCGSSAVQACHIQFRVFYGWSKFLECW